MTILILYKYQIKWYVLKTQSKPNVTILFSCDTRWDDLDDTSFAESVITYRIKVINTR